MKLFSLLLLLVAAAPIAQAQKLATETAAVKQTVTAFFDGMRRGDSTSVRRTLAPAAVFQGFGGKPGQPAGKSRISIDTRRKGKCK